MLRKLRIITGMLVLFSLTLFFFTAIDFLSVLPKIQFMPALLAVNIVNILFLCIITLLFGRIYCSTLCPLGIMQDFVIWFSKKANKHKKRFTYSPAWTKLRYSILFIMVLAFVSGFTLLPALLDPYSIYGRMVTHLLSPVWLSITNSLAMLSDQYELYIFTKKAIFITSIEAFLLSITSLLIIGFMALRYGRLYCNTICPVGTILGSLSPFALYKISINRDTCNHCGLCAANCKSSCFDSKTQNIDYNRCISCFNCIESCRQDALSFTTCFSTKQTEKTLEPPNTMVISRRHFLTTSALSMAGAAAFITKATASPFASPKGETGTILPPGAKSHVHFSTHCTSCHLCVSKCPNQVLKPMSIGYDMSSMMQPTMDFKKGYCDYDCNLCGTLCPSHAIEPLSLEQKQTTKIGYAIFNKVHCVVETDDVNCGNCAIHCPTKAITMVDYKDKKMPLIDLSRCIGCGSCEYHCPVHPGAIKIIGFEEEKLLS